MVKKVLYLIVLIVMFTCTGCKNQTKADLLELPILKSEEVLTSRPMTYYWGIEADRGMMDYQRILARYQSDEATKDKIYAAVGVITVMSMDVSEVNTKYDMEKNIEGAQVPIIVQIEKILSKSSECSLKEGERIEVKDSTARWYTDDQIYSIYKIGDAAVPIDVVGAQYIVTILGNKIDGELRYEYVVESHTIPISNNISSVEYVVDRYEQMNLPDDVRETSENFIRLIYGENVLPSTEEINQYIEDTK